MLFGLDITKIAQEYAFWGYLLLFVGTFVEGETILIIFGALCALSSNLDITIAITCAFAGSLSGDQFAFYITRWKKDWIKHKLRKKKALMNKALDLLHDHSTWWLLSFRFFYGLRNVTSFAVGLSHISAPRFILLNSIGALVWAVTFGLAGYFFGKTFINNMGHIQIQILGALCVVALILWWYRIRRNRAKAALADNLSGDSNGLHLPPEENEPNSSTSNTAVLEEKDNSH
jgi:membrane protein DedA with SNARE-associated domain